MLRDLFKILSPKRAGLLAIGVYLLLEHMSTESDYRDYIPSDSYLQEYWAANQQHFGEFAPVGLFANHSTTCSEAQTECTGASGLRPGDTCTFVEPDSET